EAQEFTGLGEFAYHRILVRFAARRLFVLDLYVPHGSKALVSGMPAGNLLLVGPPGSGKSFTLQRQFGPHVFDVRNSGSWLESAEPLALPEGCPCSFDHVEHRFHDVIFRQRLLLLLHGLLYRQHRIVWIVSARDPLQYLKEAGAADLDDWRRILEPFL